MSEYLLLVLAGVVLFVLVLLVRLARQQQALKQRIQVLDERVQRSNEDLAGLCSAAVAVDRRLAASDSRLNSILDQVHPQRQVPVNVRPAEPTQATGYEEVIQKIRKGVGIEELVRDCGLTRDEAVLLMRLHGGKQLN